MMEMPGMLRLLMFLFFGIPVGIFGTYGMILLYYGRRRSGIVAKADKYDKSTKSEPMVSVVVPTHNEEIIISRKIENLLKCSYPQEKLEIVFVDDSTDSTPSVIQGYAEKFPQIHLLRFHERMGYSPCLIAGCHAAKGDIIIIGDAGSFLDHKAISYLVSDFQNPRVGVATGRNVILNVDEEVGKSESFYVRLLEFVRKGETNMNSTIYMKGEATAVRRDLIDSLRPEDCPGAADVAIGLFATKQGYRAIYDPRAEFFEYAPSNRGDRVRQKITRAANLIKVLWKFRDMFLRRKYGEFGMITWPINFAMLVFVPLSLIGAFASLVLLTIVSPISSYAIWVVVGFSLLLLFLYSKQAVFTLLEFEYSLLRAIWEICFVRKSHDKIDLIDSTRRLD